MHQPDLNRAVARATGETVSMIKRLGFLLAETDEWVDPDDERHGPYVIDWDELETFRHTRSQVDEPIAA